MSAIPIESNLPRLLIPQRCEANLTDAQRYAYLGPQYQKEFSAGTIIPRVLIIAVVITGIVAFALSASGHLHSLPQDFMHWINTTNPIHLVIGGGVTLVVLGLVGKIIHHARNKKDELLGTDRGTCGRIGPHLETAHIMFPISGGRHLHQEVYIDTSTLDGQRNGKAYLYFVKDPANHYTVSTIVPLLGTVPYMVATMAYNLLRSVAVFGYVLVQLLREKCGTELFRKVEGEREFKAIDLIKQPAESLFRVVKAPFYALAYIFAGVYSWVNPMGGRKLGAAIEWDWNEGTSMAQGYWHFGDGKQALWSFEGGGGPNGLGRNGFYLAGCWQPLGIAKYEGGNITEAFYLPGALDEEEKVLYDIKTRTQLEPNAAK